MKIKMIDKSYDEVMALPRKKGRKPKRPNIFFRTLLKLCSLPDMISTGFSVKKIGMEKLGKKEPCLFLMNHSSFVDMEIAATLLYPRPFNIVSTSDSFIGKGWLMHEIGCISTRKFVFDAKLIFDLLHAVQKLNNSILMYPEAGYSFDGTATILPENFALFVKKLGISVVMIRTFGAFSRDPLYNNLQKRDVKVSAEMRYLLSAEDVKEKTAEEIKKVITEQFSFDNFRWQQKNQIKIDEGFRADYLHRVLYKCPHCLTEGKMEGKGITLTCHACGKVYTLDEYGGLTTYGIAAFTHIPDWYLWQRAMVRKELEEGKYLLDIPVDIAMLVDESCIYRVGEGRLTHNADGFRLVGCDGKLDYTQKPLASYSLCSDYNWYELGDVIGIGDMRALYYCFPKDRSVPVAKARLATEELYRMYKEKNK